MPLGFDPREYQQNRSKHLSRRDEDGQILAALDKNVRAPKKMRTVFKLCKFNLLPALTRA